MRSIGVNRQSSSRPVGIGKSATSKDARRSARDFSGTVVTDPWVGAGGIPSPASR